MTGHRRPLFRMLMLIAGTLTLCGNQIHARTLQQVLNFGSMRIGIALATPWAMRDERGELIGYDIDVARQLAADMGVDPELVVLPWDGLVDALEANEIDVIVAGLSISPERALRVNFSQPYSTGGLALATHLANTAEVQNLSDLDSDRFTLAVVSGSTALELADRLLPRIEVREFSNAESAGRALVAGQVDAYLEEEPVPSFLALDNPATVDLPLNRVLLESRTGFAVGKGDADFLAYLNAWIVAHESDTWLATTHNYWFQSLRWRERVGQN